MFLSVAFTLWSTKYKICRVAPPLALNISESAMLKQFKLMRLQKAPVAKICDVAFIVRFITVQRRKPSLRLGPKEKDFETSYSC